MGFVWATRHPHTPNVHSVVEQRLGVSNEAYVGHPPTGRKVMPEQVLREETRAWVDYVGWFLVGLVLLPVFGLGLVFLLGAWLDRLGRKYTVTSERVISRHGIISRKVNEIEIKNIQDVNLQQGILQRLVRTGTVGFSSAGRSGVEVMFEGVANPGQLKDLVREQVRSVK